MRKVRPVSVNEGIDFWKAAAERQARVAAQKAMAETVAAETAAGEKAAAEKAAAEKVAAQKAAAEKAAAQSKALQEAASRARDKIESKVREEVRRRMTAFSSNEAPLKVKEEQFDFEATGPTIMNTLTSQTNFASGAVETRRAEKTSEEEVKNGGGEVKRKSRKVAPDMMVVGKRLAAELAPNTGALANSPNKRSRVAAADRGASQKVSAFATAVPGSPASDRPPSSAERPVRGLAEQDADFADEGPEGDVAAALREAALSAMAAAHDPKASQARLIDLLSGDVHKLPINGTVALGRRATCEVVVSMPCVSSRHCVLICKKGHVQLKDVSSFGTYVNSTLIPKEPSDEEPPHVMLQHGDRLTLARRHGPPALLFLEASGSV